MNADLRIRAGVDRGDHRLDVDVEIAAGEVLGVVGPNGAGKSTLVDLIAGLVPATRGRISLGDAVFDDVASGAWTPVHQRGLGVLFQQPRLIRTADVRDNVAFGLRVRGVNAADARRRADTWLDAVGVAHRADAHVDDISGGEAQRVALARCLAVDPSALLVDEPFAAVDAAARTGLREVVSRHLRAAERPAVFVTHDPVDAELLADRLLVLEEGAITQIGTADALRAAPATPFVAALFELNVLYGTADDGVVTVDGWPIDLTVADRSTRGPVAVTIAPNAIAVHASAPSGSPRNTWTTTIARIEELGDVRRLHLTGARPLTADVTPGAVADLRLRPGSEVWVAVKATELSLRPR